MSESLYTKGEYADIPGWQILFLGKPLDSADVIERLNHMSDSIIRLRFEALDRRALFAGMLMGYAARLKAAEPYLRNQTITKFINDMANQLNEESAMLLQIAKGENNGS